MKIKKKPYYIFILVACLLFFISPISHAKTQQLASLPSVYIEELTSPEIADAIKSGYNSVIIPTGGSEQNLAHLIIGKHNKILYYTAAEIAKQLGNTLVAPVIAYVPEGNISPPDGHMKFAGTISLHEETFLAMLEDIATSLKQHGFKQIYLIGEHGESQAPQQKLAEKLTKQWKNDGVRVVHISDYYANNGQNDWVSTLNFPQGAKLKDPTSHAGFEDSSELMAVSKTAVRENLRENDALLATAEYGKKLLDLKIKAAIKQIKLSKIENAPTP
jgi:creatinine amidohydrolase/Fe(II)-dependent formamide hydrolase-like protein